VLHSVAVSGQEITLRVGDNVLPLINKENAIVSFTFSDVVGVWLEKTIASRLGVKKSVLVKTPGHNHQIQTYVMMNDELYTSSGVILKALSEMRFSHNSSTLPGSSGAPIMTKVGAIAGIHTTGTAKCNEAISLHFMASKKESDSRENSYQEVLPEEYRDDDAEHGVIWDEVDYDNDTAWDKDPDEGNIRISRYQLKNNGRAFCLTMDAYTQGQRSALVNGNRSWADLEDDGDFSDFEDTYGERRRDFKGKGKAVLESVLGFQGAPANNAGASMSSVQEETQSATAPVTDTSVSTPEPSPAVEENKSLNQQKKKKKKSKNCESGSGPQQTLPPSGKVSESTQPDTKKENAPRRSISEQPLIKSALVSIRELQSLDGANQEACLNALTKKQYTNVRKALGVLAATKNKWESSASVSGTSC